MILLRTITTVIHVGHRVGVTAGRTGQDSVS